MKFKSIHSLSNFFFILILSASCNLSSFDQNKRLKTSHESEMLKLVDSTSNLNTENLAEKVAFTSDSIYTSQKEYAIELSESDFKILKEACLKQNISLNVAERIFPDFKLDTNFVKLDKNKQFFIKYYSFDKNALSFENYAVVPAYDDGLTMECAMYVFQKNTLIAKHQIFHRYGLDLDYFIDEDEKSVFYYRQNYMSGTGIWWFNYYFYKIDGQKVLPVLNLIESSNLQPFWANRSFTFQTKLKSTNPLVCDMIYSNSFTDTLTSSNQYFINDSTRLTYNWIEEKKQFVADYSHSKLNYSKILTYYLSDNELLFVNTHSNFFKEIIQNKDTISKKLVIDYLKTITR